MAEPSLDAGISEEEFQAAIAEIESLGEGVGDGGPGGEEPTDENVVAVPVPTRQNMPVKAAPADAPESPAARPAPDAVATSEESEPAPAAAGSLPAVARRGWVAWWVRQLLGWLPIVGRRLAPAEADSTSADGASGSGGLRPARWLLRLLDITLNLINRPFRFLSPAARQTLGLVALITMVTSLLAACLLPPLTAGEDPLFFLNQRTGERLAAPPETFTDERP